LLLAGIDEMRSGMIGGCVSKMLRLGLLYLSTGLPDEDVVVVGRTNELEKEVDAEWDARLAGLGVVRLGIDPSGMGDACGLVLMCAVGFGGLRHGGGFVLGRRVGGGSGRGVR
jgi:hypothetical protein